MTDITPISDARLAEIKSGLEGVTPGPWRKIDRGIGSYPIYAFQGPIEVCPACVYGLGDAIHIANCDPQTIASLIARLRAAEERTKLLERMDMEAGTHVESLICMRSNIFTGEPPYVGWKGLGLALQEEFDARDSAKREVAFFKAGVEVLTAKYAARAGRLSPENKV